MNYTVNKLAKLSGVSIRTLHFYDEIGLLKPAYVTDAGYRYYQEEQLLLLQQILFFRELGFELKQIQSILKRTDFDKIHALELHKKDLRAKINRMQKLLKTIDITIDHLEGKQMMKEKEIYSGFSKEKQAEYEKYLVERLGPNRPEFEECKRNAVGKTQADAQKAKQVFEEFNKAFTQAINKKLAVDSPEVQKLVAKHYKHIQQFWTPTKESYIDLGKMYTEHPDFKAYYAAYHPDLAQYLADAMKVYAEREL